MPRRRRRLVEMVTGPPVGGPAEGCTRNGSGQAFEHPGNSLIGLVHDFLEDVPQGLDLLEHADGLARHEGAVLHVAIDRGVAQAAHYGPEGFVLAWPSAESGPLPVEGGVAVAFHREIAAAPDPEARRRELEEEFAARQSPFPRAEALGVHDLIDPRQTRPELCRWVDRIQPLLPALLGQARFTIRP